MVVGLLNVKWVACLGCYDILPLVLKPKTKFYWDDQLTILFEQVKTKIVKEIEMFRRNSEDWK